MSGPELPESLTSVLARARELEAAARGTHRERAAIAATSTLLAAHEAGWQQTKLARFLEMPVQTVHKRVQPARANYPDETGSRSTRRPSVRRRRSLRFAVRWPSDTG